jgi:hypothetical protein
MRPIESTAASTPDRMDQDDDDDPLGERLDWSRVDPAQRFERRELQREERGRFGRESEEGRQSVEEDRSCSTPDRMDQDDDDDPLGERLDWSRVDPQDSQTFEELQREERGRFGRESEEGRQSVEEDRSWRRRGGIVVGKR